MEPEPPKKEPLVQPQPAAPKVDDYICDICGEGPIDPEAEIPCSTPEQVKALMKGLDSKTAAERLEAYGPNEIPQKVVRWYTILLKQLTSSMAVMIEIAMVLAAAVQEWEDFAIIGVLLTINASIGFYEEYEALMKVEGIKSALSPMTAVKRNGEFIKLPTATLVPGDIIFLRGGDSVPADVDWLDGDPMAVDTAALTGEPFPRKYPDSKGNKRVLSGCMVVSGNSYLLVQRTGIFTEMGSATLLMQQSTKPTQSVFERSIIEVCELVMAVAVLFLVAVFLVELHRGEQTIDILTDCLAILIASVPVALPVVMQVTLALGAGEMAKQQAIVTHLTAMQEIASMTMLCSDKTGTLTTAKIQVFYDQIWTTAKFDKGQILEWAAVASNPHADDDPIDVAMLRSYRDAFSEDYDSRIKQYNVTKFVGFTPEVKRTVAYATHSEQGEIKVSKGLLDKILATGDDGGDMWTCVNTKEIRAEVEKIDQAMSLKGYKTLGVAVGSKDRRGNWVMEFAGIVPMLDPPRDDTKWVIEQIKLCGIQVKMITGDHQNIAAETSRLIGLGDNILHREKLAARESDEKDALVRDADGFAQVMPRDKNDVVRILQSLNYIVGMTGDGVNDAPALKQAHIGIAVEGSTDAARSAADIVLTTEGLAPIFTAVLESRKIFQRVNSYVLYRISATIQIVLVLSLLIFTVNQTIKALYIILLALFNDLTMVTISYDNVIPSRSPDRPTINRLLRISTVFGILMTLESLCFYFFGELILAPSSNFRSSNAYTESLMYLQISIAIESLIFVTRVPEAPFYSSRPVLSLLLSVVIANVAVTLLVTTGLLGPKISIADAAVVWVYDIVWFIIIDLLKIPLTMTIENFFPPEPSNMGIRTAESSAAHAPVDAQHTLILPDIDTGYSFLRDAAGVIGTAFNRAVCNADTAENMREVSATPAPAKGAGVV
mmetsp:Transcript_7920/g.24308  ORF Transcript_7920/g.24308 Transcript_7920/m.24308 type:complete len:944 (-) Transcript_7920:422-3253(-)